MFAIYLSMVFVADQARFVYLVLWFLRDMAQIFDARFLCTDKFAGKLSCV